MKRDTLKKVFLAAIAFLSYYLGISMQIHAQGLFLSHLGARALPPVMIGVAALVVVYSFASIWLSGRFSPPAIFMIALAMFMVLAGGLFFIQEPTLKITLFLLMAGFFYFFLDIAIVNFAKSLLNPIQEKSILPFMFGFSSLGLIVGSTWSGVFHGLHERTGLGLIPAVILVVIIALVFGVKLIFKADIAEDHDTLHPAAAAGSMKRSVRYVFSESHLFRALTLAIFLIVGINVLMEFKFKTVLSQAYPNEDVLSAMLGAVYMAQSIAVMLLNFTVIRKLLFRFGVANLMLFFPVSLLIATAAGSVFHLTVPFVIAMYLTFSISFFTYVFVAGSQVFSLAPTGLGQSVFFMVRGIISALSYLFYSVILLIFTFNLSLEKTLNTFFLAVVILLLLWQLLRFRKIYFETLKNNLFSKDAPLRQRSIELLAERNYREHGELYLRHLLGLEELPIEVKGKVMESLGIIGNVQSVLDLLKVLSHDPNPKNKFSAIHAINSIISDPKKLNEFPVTKHLLFRTYEDLFLSDIPLYLKLEIIASLKHFDLEDVLDFLESHLKNDDIKIKMNILETLGNFEDRGVIMYIEPLLENENVRVQSAAIKSLWRFADVRTELFPKITQILGRTDADGIESSLYLIGAIQAHWEKNYVVSKLVHPDERIRTLALMTLITLGDMASVDPLIDKMHTIAQTRNFEAMDVILAHYRNFDPAMKTAILKRIQEREGIVAGSLAEAFRQSKYVFHQEVSALS